MKRVAVVGSSGAGKSTFARELGARLGLPVLALDEHYWRPGWQRPDRERWRREQVALLTSQPRWIADGNYGSTLDARLPLVDTVVLLDLNRWVCLRRVLHRNLRNRGRSVQARGCPEHLSWSLLRYVWSFPKQHRPRLLRAIVEHAPHAHVVVLRTRREVRTYLGG